MTVHFVHTSALYALVAEADAHHDAARRWYREFWAGESDRALVTSNYVVAEFAELMERRFGRSAAIDVLVSTVAPFEIMYVGRADHLAAVHRYARGDEDGPSLVDCSCFTLMHAAGLTSAFTFDGHFSDAGFHVVPAAA